MVRNSNTPPIVEERKVETVEELREEVKELKETEKKFRLLSLFRKKKVSELESDLENQKKHASKMDDLAWENWEEKKRVEKERDELKKQLAEEKEKSSNLQKELNEIKTKSTAKGDWQDFYNWIHSNIVDIGAKGVGKGNIKAGKRNEFPSLVKTPGLMGLLLNKLEKTLGRDLANYSGIDTSDFVNGSIEFSPDDLKDSGFTYQLDGNIEQVLSMNRGARRDYEKLFREWKNSINKL